jgi:tetratricopeptide (TPR) repeat protein
MKASAFYLQGRQKRLLMFLATAFLVFSSVSQTSAQPGGCYKNTWRYEYCREQREKLLERFTSEIEHLDKQIVRDPETADHYYRRGKVYSGMFASHFGVKDVEFDGKVYFADIVAKAIVDFTRAIELLPQVEYFVERGQMYWYQWQDEIGHFHETRRDENNSDEKIRQTIDKLFIYNELFHAAERDFLKGIELSDESERSKLARHWLFSLRGRRATLLYTNEAIAKLIGAEKPADVALADLDYAIEFYKLHHPNKESNLLYSAWIQKGAAAKLFGRDDTALEAFREAEKAQVKNSYPECFLYRDRAEIFSKRANYDAAIKDLTFAIDNNLNCKRMSELRGDIHLLKGDLAAAIDSYSVILNDGQGFNRDIYWKRGKVYLETGEAQKAIDDFTAAIQLGSLCEKDYQFRARAFRLAGDTQAAEADEERARQALKDQKKYGGSEYCYYHKN